MSGKMRGDGRQNASEFAAIWQTLRTYEPPNQPNAIRRQEVDNAVGFQFHLPALYRIFELSTDYAPDGRPKVSMGLHKIAGKSISFPADELVMPIVNGELFASDDGKFRRVARFTGSALNTFHDGPLLEELGLSYALAPRPGEWRSAGQELWAPVEPEDVSEHLLTLPDRLATLALQTF